MSDLRGRLLSAAFVFFLAMLVVANAPASEERDSLVDDFAYPIDLLHLNQTWAVFSPDPSRVAVEVVGAVTFASGEQATYRYPRSGDYVTVFRGYRFRKFQRYVNQFAHRETWEDTARRIAAEFDEPVVRVTLFRELSYTPTPGTDEARIDDSIQFYVLDLNEPDSAAP